ncbi:hypothetical protein Q4Z88_16060 [Acinetobacter baumannii]|uniref:hypothetical protein n=1 Tax=Acinetobacter sp. UC24323 TaxID=2839946 RepID=UPI00209DD687|nr:hypothetical protein [Acinetobacter sp. UC24323]MCO9048652.1 hypothetical protein [Acinetobacter sp. UC24323]MDC4508712.1 hypothetical protein [Acinetobacter baumannii]HCQ9648256.1 hypothetical protein [Acinetobacter baumannii]
MSNVSNQSNKDKLLELKRQQSYQSWHEPALKTLTGLLKERKANLKKRNHDENQAAVTRDEFMQGLVDDHGVHGINLYHAGVIISSLYRAKKIRYLGSFIQIIEGDGGA